MDLETLWSDTLTHIEKSISKATLTTWFRAPYITRNEEGVVHLAVPNRLARDWFVNKYHKLVLGSLREVDSSVRSVEYMVVEGVPQKKRHRTHSESKVEQALPLDELYVDKSNNLNPRYTFDAFIVGGFNELAHAAAQAVVKNPGSAYNPLFVYGRSGHGKTHLIQAIGNAIKTIYSGRRVYYVTSEVFTQELVDGLRANQMKEFKDKYRQYDVFIMDDVQFLSDKEKSQEELFHLFNILHDNNKQIVFSSDTHPNYIPKLEERLKTRFGAGMIVDIPAPDTESRMAILKAKTARSDITLPEETFEYLSSVIDSNIRQLEGALNAVICQSQLKGRELSLNEVGQLVKDSVRPKRVVSVDEVVQTVAHFYNTTEEDIYKKTRKKEVVLPRQLIMYILREDYGFAFPAIGQKIGKRDHTTVIHSHDRIKTKLKTQSDLVREVEQIRAQLQ